MNLSHCTPPCLYSQLDKSIIGLVQYLEDHVGHELKINSAFRSVDYEKSKGRPGSSSHCKGLAVDISCRDSVSRFALISSAIDFGCRRIGVYPTFLHFDMDTCKTSPVIWVK